MNSSLSRSLVLLCGSLTLAMTACVGAPDEEGAAEDEASTVESPVTATDLIDQPSDTEAAAAVSLPKCSGTVRSIISTDPKPWNNGLKYTKILLDSVYGVAVFGTANVSGQAMKETCYVTKSLIGAVRTNFRGNMRGYKVHLKSERDRPGGGSAADGTSMDAERQCGPSAKNWANLVHEFAHSVLSANGIDASENEKMRLARKKAGVSYDPTYAAEYFPWLMERWFQVRPSDSWASIPAWENTIAARIFEGHAEPVCYNDGHPNANK